MPRISYVLNNGKGEWYEVSPDNKEALILRFSPQLDGYIIVDNTVYRVKSGEVKIPWSRMRDEEYALRVECDREGYELEEFRKRGADIVMPPTDESVIRSLIHRCRKNEERLRVLEDKLARIVERTEGHRIFN